MRRLTGALAICLGWLAGAGCVAGATDGATDGGTDGVRTVSRVDLERYSGLWYEIASFPKWFQRGCTGSTAEYTLRDDGRIGVVNRCVVAGRQRVARGVARVVDPTEPGQLEVSFFGPFWGKYWILDLDADYRHVVIGHPKRNALWIMAREPELDPAVLADILERLRESQGYDLSRLRMTEPAAVSR